MTPATIKAVSEALKPFAEALPGYEDWRDGEYIDNCDRIKLGDCHRAAAALALLAADQAKERLAGQIARMRKWLGHRAAKTELTGFEMLASTIADACDDLLRLSPATAGEWQEYFAKIAGAPEKRDEDFMARRPDDARDADQRDLGRAMAAADIRSAILPPSPKEAGR